MGILAECHVCHTKQTVKRKKCRSCGQDMDTAKKARKVRYHVVYKGADGRQKKLAVSSIKRMDPYSLEDAHKVNAKHTVGREENKLELFDRRTEDFITFQELADWYLGLEKVKSLASFDTVKVCLNKFTREYGARRVTEIKPSDLENLQAKRAKQGLKPKSVDDEINYVKTMVIKGFDNDMVRGESAQGFQACQKTSQGPCKPDGTGS